MDPMTLDALQFDLYRTVLTMIEVITLSLSFALVLSLAIGIISAIGFWVAEKKPTARRLYYGPAQSLTQAPQSVRSR